MAKNIMGSVEDYFPIGNCNCMCMCLNENVYTSFMSLYNSAYVPA